MGSARTSVGSVGNGVLVVVALASLVGCRGKVLATGSLPGSGTVTTTFVPGTKGVVLWADTDAKWTGSEHSKPDFSYEVEARRDGKSLAKASCSTKDATTSVCGTSMTVGNSHDADCEIKLGCALGSLGSGAVELTIVGKVGSNVTQVKKMSINVREE